MVQTARSCTWRAKHSPLLPQKLCNVVVRTDVRIGLLYFLPVGLCVVFVLSCIVDCVGAFSMYSSISIFGPNLAPPVGECGSARGSRKTHSMDPRRISPCEVDSNEGRVHGRMEGRTRVQVESEVVHKCKGNNNEGACDMLC